MKPTKPPSQTLFNEQDILPDYSASLSNFKAEPVTPIPSVAEIAAHQAGEMEHPLFRSTPALPKRSETSILQGLLGGDVRVLLDDRARNPRRYGPETSAVLDRLEGNPTAIDLTPEDQYLLNMAVLEFASAPKPEPPEVMKPKPRPKKEIVAQNGEGPARTLPWSEDAPEQKPESYWWMK
jgi:hypothetical protein